MSSIDLTLPLNHEWMPDEVFPTALHFYVGPKFHPDKGIVMGSDTGTSIALPAVFAEFRKGGRLDDVPTEKLFLRPATILDIPKNANEELTAKDIEPAWAQTKPRAGDAILIRTGWGDTGMHTRPGSRYMLESPHLTPDGAEALASKMSTGGHDLLLMDTALIGWPDKHLIPEWCSLEPRPSPWPSPEAKVYLHLYTEEKMNRDFASELALARASIMTVKRLVGCGALTKKRVRMIVSPLRVIRGVASTCRVVAVEE